MKTGEMCWDELLGMLRHDPELTKDQRILICMSLNLSDDFDKLGGRIEAAAYAVSEAMEENKP